MLKDGRCTRELDEIALRVYGPPERIYDRQFNRLLVLGALKGRPWGDTARLEEIREAARGVLTSGAKDGVEKVTGGRADA